MALALGVTSNSRTRDSFIGFFGSGNTNNSVGVDSNGNAFHSGFTLRKLNSYGEIQWQRDWDPPGSGNEAVHFNASNDVIIGGADTNANTANIVSFNNSTGAILLQKQVALTAVDYNDSVGSYVDSSGNIYLVVNDLASTYQSSVLIKFNSAGTVTWSRRISYGSGNCWPVSVVTDSSLNVYVTMAYVVGTNFNTAIVKYNSSGTVQWQRGFNATNGTSGVYPQGSAIDAIGDLYVFMIGTGIGSTTAVAKIASNGTLSWLSEFTGSGGGICTDNSYVYILKWGGAFVLKISNADGALVWQRLFNRTSTSMYGYGIAQQGNSVHIGGYSPQEDWGAKFNKSGSEEGSFNVSPSVATWNWKASSQTFSASNSGTLTYAAISLTLATLSLSSTTSSTTAVDGGHSYSVRRI